MEVTLTDNNADYQPIPKNFFLLHDSACVMDGSKEVCSVLGQKRLWTTAKSLLCTYLGETAVNVLGAENVGRPISYPVHVLVLWWM